MYRLLISLPFLILLQLTPEQVVQKQLDMYNAKDLDGFMSVMSGEVRLYNYSSITPSASGWTEVRDLYKNLFDRSPDLNSKLLNRIVLGNKVIDHELITGRMGKPLAIELVVIYEVQHAKIVKITVLRK